MQARFDDIDQYFETIPWQGDFVQLDRGRLDARIELASGRGVSVMRTSYNRAFDQRGVAPSHGRTFGFRVRSGAEIRWCNQAFVNSTLVVFPEDGSFEAWSGPGFEVVVVTVDMADLSTVSALSELPGGLAAITPAGGVYDCRNDDMQALRTAAVAMLAVPGTGGLELEFEIARLVLTALDRHRTVLRAPNLRMRDRAYANAVELIRTGGHELSVPELCHAVGASERTLRYAFAEHVGMSPQTYNKAVRLARVRAALRYAAGDGPLGVGDIAARWCFWHVGQFARDYRDMFGELPSSTRKRMVDSDP
jgi:AraC family ethanolamine operon transcriptional activator